MLVLVCITLAAFASPQEGALAQEPGTILLRVDGRPVLRYRHEHVPYKPYIDRLTTPSGVNVLLDAPSDHLHHHGLMFAVKLDGTNFWEEAEAPGRQVGEAPQGNGDSIAQELRWESSDGTVIAREQREVRLHSSPEASATLLTWRTRLEAVGIAETVLTGAHYHGLGLRFVRDMDGASEVFSTSSDPGEVVRGSERLRRGAWCAFRGRVGGRPVTVALFDHPDNPRPATWFSMTEPFAYMSATLNAHREMLPFRSLNLRYGVALWDGHAPAEEITRLHATWLGPTTSGETYHEGEEAESP